MPAFLVCMIYLPFDYLFNRINQETPNSVIISSYSLIIEMSDLRLFYTQKRVVFLQKKVSSRLLLSLIIILSHRRRRRLMNWLDRQVMFHEKSTWKSNRHLVLKYVSRRQTPPGVQFPYKESQEWSHWWWILISSWSLSNTDGASRVFLSSLSVIVCAVRRDLHCTSYTTRSKGWCIWFGFSFCLIEASHLVSTVHLSLLCTRSCTTTSSSSQGSKKSKESWTLSWMKGAAVSVLIFKKTSLPWVCLIAKKKG